MFVLGLVLFADALVIDKLPDRPRRIYCDAMRLGPDGKPYPACPVQTDHHTLYVVLATVLSVVAVLVASRLVWGRHQNSMKRQAMRGR